jgi:predicted RNase H-like HicB family nuclease
VSLNPITQQQFTVIIEHDPESGRLVGSVAELPGCYTQAPDMASLEANMCEAIEVYLDTVNTTSQPAR